MSCRRLDELDALRGVALGMMLLSNFVSDLDFFGAMTVAAGDGWWWFSRLTGGLFVAVAGVAAFLASRKGGTRQALHRSLKLAGIASYPDAQWQVGRADVARLLNPPLGARPCHLR